MACCKRQKDDEKEKEPSAPLSKILGVHRRSIPLMVVGAICGFLSGATFPAFSVVFGQTFQNFATLTGDALTRETVKMSLIFFGLGCATLVFTYGQMTCWALVGEAISNKLRKRYLESLLKQEVAYFDFHGSGESTSVLSTNITQIRVGISDKMSSLFYYAAQIGGGVILAFVYGWKMTLVMLALSPLMVVAGGVTTYMMTDHTKKINKKFANANDLATEALSGIRTVYSFVAESLILTRYGVHLKRAYKSGVKTAHITGVSTGFAFFFVFGVYALGFWYGGTLIRSGEMNIGDVLIVFFAIVIGAMGVGQGAQVVPDLAKAKGAAAAIFAVIEREPEIDGNFDKGEVIDKFKGGIEFKNVSFAYPTRAEIDIFKNFSLKVSPGQTIALVGPSGGGKSSIMSLIERFYDPKVGDILVDGKDIKKLDLHWYRRQIGLVSQEPVLFSGSIAENIRYGKSEASDDEVIAAAKAANAYDFIMEQTSQFDTLVGENGLQLSGGQKQRIAIARAVLKDPKILLLDEATSALDAESEYLVQAALDKLMKGRTTIIIAHRLTTVKNADKLCVLQKGKLVEEGSHKALLAKGGVYAHLVSRQLQKDKKKEKNDESSDDYSPLNENSDSESEVKEKKKSSKSSKSKKEDEDNNTKSRKKSTKSSTKTDGKKKT